MDFINKLIKKGIFSFLLVFSFFAFSNAIKVKAANCDIKLNDGNKYLVVNDGLDWTDSGVTVTCDSTPNPNVSVQINNNVPIETTNSAFGTINGYASNTGFYKIKYFLTEDPEVNIIRQLRVLPNNLNSSRNFWPGDVDKVNTENNDVFNRIIDADFGYLAVGDFSNIGYIVAFNTHGEFLWKEQLGGTSEISRLTIKDIIRLGTSGKYYIVGEYVNASNEIKAYLKLIEIDDNGTINFENEVTTIEGMTSANKIVTAGEYLVVAGYKQDSNTNKFGILVRYTLSGENLVSPTTIVANVTSQYNSMISLVEESQNKIVVVGNSSVTSESLIGAVGGSVTVCSVDTIFTCENKTPYYYTNKNGSTATITSFKDIVSHGTGYLIVGQSRVDGVAGSTVTTNSGLEDSIVVLLDETFKVKDVKLSGTTSSDSLDKIKKVEDGSFVAVGNLGSNGYYNFITVKDGTLQMSESRISGSSTKLNDVLVEFSNDEEIQYAFIGKTQSAQIEGVFLGSKGNDEALFVILDNTTYSNYENINILQNDTICGNQKECSVENMNEEYWLLYGTKKVTFAKGQNEDFIVSTLNITTYDVYHKFVNSQGLTIMIGRKIYIKESPVAPNITSEEMGIHKWYEYSRPENITLNINGDKYPRIEMWDEYYYPVADGLDKENGKTYYKLCSDCNPAVFQEVDFSENEGKTKDNYIKLPVEPQNLNVAFQSVEKAKEFSKIQEITRIAFVDEPLDMNAQEGQRSIYFSGDGMTLLNQNYYFIYYIDLKFGDGRCEIRNGQLLGNCTHSLGYAFSDLKQIIKLTEYVVEKYEYFVSERIEKNGFNVNSNIGFPVTEEYKEELKTIAYRKTASINVKAGLAMEVKYYAPNGNASLGYGEFEENYTTLTKIDGSKNVSFSSSGDFKEEGKYVVRYCYNYGKANENCGEEASFVIDRTAPIINFNLLGGGTGQIYESSTPTTLIKVKTSALITSISDIDPYAYTILDGKVYYLKCNEEVNSPSCINDWNMFVKKSYDYDKNDPDKIFEIHVQDRAGNKLDAYFIVGTANPTLDIPENEDEENTNYFDLIINFYEKNDIDSMDISYVKSEDCLQCTDPGIMREKIETYIRAIYYRNEQELLKKQENPEDESEPNMIKELVLRFNLSLFGSEGPTRGLSIPKITHNPETGEYIIEEDFEILVVSKGLYRFAIFDDFANYDEEYAGIGLGKAELDIYIENDANYIESKGTATSAPGFTYLNGEGVAPVVGTIENGYFPIREDEIGEFKPANSFIASDPNTYAYYESIPASLQSDFDQEMFYTSQFVYIKFLVNTSSGLKISLPTTISKLGSWGKDTNLKCEFAFYGTRVDTTKLPNCTNKYYFENMGDSVVKEKLKALGIYIVGIEQVENQETNEKYAYYYIAFTKDGIYNVNSEVLPVFTNDGGTQNLSVPVDFSFTIDSSVPNVEFELVCNNAGGTCVGDRDEYTKSDFMYNDTTLVKRNIGNYDMKLIINKDYFDFINASGQPLKEENRLMIVSFDGTSTYHNAYDYSYQHFDEEGNYLMFSESGSYEITFIDAGGNSVVYRFMIDKEPPKIVEIKDLENKSFNGYQQYVDVRVTVSDNSFVEGDGNALLIVFKTDSGSSEKRIEIINDSGMCVIASGSGDVSDVDCNVVDKGNTKEIEAWFELELNKEERKSNEQTMSVTVYDYFGNSVSATQSFIFDNVSPYIYFDGSYKPATNFQIDSKERNNWLTTDANASLGHFECEKIAGPDGKDTYGVMFVASNGTNVIIYCKDTPENEGILNNVSIDTFEAMRVSYNNYVKKLSGSYEEISNGIFLDVDDVVYKKVYSGFADPASFVAAKNDSTTKVYTKGAYVQVKPNEYIDPNARYIYTDLNTSQEISVKEVYESGKYLDYTSASSCSNNQACILYRMYIDVGYFTEDNYTKYSWYDTNSYTEVTNKAAMIEADYRSYYYSNVYVEDSGKYLKAKTLENSCVIVSGMNGGICSSIPADRIKLENPINVGTGEKTEKFNYYNIVTPVLRETSVYIETIKIAETTERKAIKDTRIWQIATDGEGNPIKFGFGITGGVARPIIFTSKDGAGNIGSNHLETVIAIADKSAPTLGNVSSIEYKKDESSNDNTKDNYVQVVKYYKVIDGLGCVKGKTYYTTKDGISYQGAVCNDFWDPYEEHYVQVIEYEKVKDGLVKDINTVYYIAEIVDLGVDGNHLTDKDFVVTFNEPIYRVECSYYVYDSTTDNAFEEKCDYDNVEFSYRDEKTTFVLSYKNDKNLDNYYVNYKIVAYDFARNQNNNFKGNPIVVQSLFTDKEKPILELNSDVPPVDKTQEVDYSNPNAVTRYNEDYLNSLFRNEVKTTDKINSRITTVGAAGQITNTMTYDVIYKQFNFGITYSNYVKEGNTFIRVPDEQPKEINKKYYILIKDTKLDDGYVLKGNSGSCKDGYCYIEDDRNYYPSLLENDAYWINIGTSIPKTAIGVFKIEYKVTDYCGNISDTIRKTIYIGDTRAPSFKIDGRTLDSKYGWHNNVTLSFENESLKDTMLYTYNCTIGSESCVLPDEIFAEKIPGVSNFDVLIENVLEKKFNAESIYKIYFHDSGKYVSTQSCDISSDSLTGCEDSNNQEEVMSLRYNYVEYTFKIDQTAPTFTIEAKKDSESKLYYELSLTGDDSLYCVVGGRMSAVNFDSSVARLCQNILTGQSVVTEKGNEVIVSRFSKNQVVSETTYKRILPLEQKFFYNTYYRRDGNQFDDYNLGESYDEDNVYLITSIKLFFNDDGSYAVQAIDKAGNTAGRSMTNIGIYEPSSKFEIDNTAPTYNKSQNSPTGINYWYSVPSEVVSFENMEYVTNIVKKNVKDKAYDIMGSNLNYPFFYSFASKQEAYNYLVNIYTEHINNQEDNVCQSVGFRYSYYDPTDYAMKTECFIDDTGGKHKNKALNKITSLLNDIIYPTFSGNILFGSNGINQIACDSSISEYCDSQMYKYVYLKKTYNGNEEPISRVTETCQVENNVECIKIKVRILRDSENGNYTSYVLGEVDNKQDPDSALMKIYSSSSGDDTSGVYDRSDSSVKLSKLTYYVFEESDKKIEYDNSFASDGKVIHYNTTYYAFYVDDNEYLKLRAEDDSGEYSLSLTNGSGGAVTNHFKYNLIIRMEGDYKQKYEIYEVKDDKGYFMEVYSYIRLSIGGTQYNINDYFVPIKDKDGNVIDYYFSIKLVDVPYLQENKFNVELFDRAGNKTSFQVSHSQVKPVIQVSYGGEGKDQYAMLEIIGGSILTAIESDSIKVSFSTDRSEFTTNLTSKILAALKCTSADQVLDYGCINNGSINGKSRYAVKITDVEGLYGFFRVYAKDNHGNDNSIEFMFNPADLSADFLLPSNAKYPDPIDQGEISRILTNEELKIEWNNKINYLILYKEVKNGENSEYVEVCNTEIMGTKSGLCSATGDPANYVEIKTDNGEYVSSIVHYVDEGYYKAMIVNRASIVINSVCIENGEVLEDCKTVKTKTSNNCSWANNPEYCAGALEIITGDVVHYRSGINIKYKILEIDKTAPSYDVKDFVVHLPSGDVAFENGGIYTNASVSVSWQEKYVELKYTCEYITETGTENCSGNHTGFNTRQTFEFNVDNKRSTRFTFWFEDYAGNSTESSSLSFTIMVKLPEIAVYEYANGQILKDKIIENNSSRIPKIKNDAKLLCYYESVEVDCSEVYSVEIQKLNASGVGTPMLQHDMTLVSLKDSEQGTYKFVVYIKGINDKIYKNLSVEAKFEIDKVPPEITIKGNMPNELYGIYKGNVEVIPGGTGTIYRCNPRAGADAEYVCEDTPLVESFTSSYILSETGSYKVISVDEIGNVTKGDKIKYLTIDNDNPDISVVAKTSYIEYKMAEQGYTNANAVIVSSTDNSVDSKFMYCLQKTNELCEWVMSETHIMEFTEEGYYRVKPVDIVGNEGIERSFIIYRQKPKFDIYYEDTTIPEENAILSKGVLITWQDPNYISEAPIVKVTVNGYLYNKRDPITNTGEYVFVFVDLAGNTTTHKISINKNENICLDDMCIKPNKQYLFQVDNIKFNADEEYRFKENDVFILATPTNYYGANSSCENNMFSYKSLLDKKSFIMINQKQADALNTTMNYSFFNLSQKEIDLINEIGGSVYIFVVDKEVAKDLGFKLDPPKKFNIDDPLGFALIVVAGIGLIAIGCRLVIFKKKVKVLK